MFSRGKRDGGLAASHGFADLARRHGDALLIPHYPQVRHVIGNFELWERGGYAGNFCHLRGNVLQSPLPFLVQDFVIFLEVEFERLDHTDDFLLAYFLASPDRVLMRAVVEQRIANEVLPADQEPGALRPTNRFAAAE